MVILGLGANLGDRVSTLRRACELIAVRGILRKMRRSTIVETPALLPKDAPADWDIPFLNLAVAGETDLEPAALLESIKNLEKELGREDRARWAPRELDIDILAWDDRRIELAGLVVPHPGLLERAFAIGPLAELAGGFVPPGQARDARALSSKLMLAPKLVAIVNVTPDSFSDGGQFDRPERLSSRARELVDAGAQVLDVGAESTRPGAAPLDAESEWTRLAPALEALNQDRQSWRAILSVDTRHPETARKALAAGAGWINDVGGLSAPGMRRLIADSGIDAVVMHSLSVPADPTLTLPIDADPVEAVLSWGERKLAELAQDGIARDRVILDPGIGFGKTPGQSLALIRGAGRLRELGTRILVGHSRKSFLSSFTQRPFADRDVETLAASLALADSGADYLRIHNVDWHARALRVHRAIGQAGGRA